LTISIYESKTLSGNEAVKAIDEYIKRLEKRKVEGLTEKQVYSMIKIGKVLRKTLSQK
jgi:hypothetical protein